MYCSSNSHRYQSTESLMLCKSQIIRVFILPYLLKHTYVDVRCDFFLLSGLYCTACLITFWYQSNLTENAFEKDLLLIDNAPCIFYFIHMFPALFASWVFWIWIDRLNEMMVSVNSACVWGLRLTTNDSVSPLIKRLIIPDNFSTFIICLFLV